MPVQAAHVRQPQDAGIAGQADAHALARRIHRGDSMQQDGLLEQVVQEWEALCRKVAAHTSA